MLEKILQWFREHFSSDSQSRINQFFWALAAIWTGLVLAQGLVDLLFEGEISPHFTVAFLLDICVWLLGMIGIGISLRGITNRLKTQKEYETKIKESEEKYRQLVDMSPDAIAVHSKGKILYVNKSAIQLMRANSAEELIGTPLIDFIHPDSRSVVMERVMKMMATGKALPAEEEIFVRRDGSLVPVETIASPLIFNGVPAIQTITRDISDRKAIQQAKEESNRQLREMLESIQLIAVMMDTHGRLFFCNDYLLELTGWKREEVLGKNWFTTFLPPEVNIAEFFQENIISGALPVYFENPMMTRSGERLWVAWHNTILRDSSGNIAGATSIGQNITERKRTEAAIDRIEQGLSAKIGEEFFGSAAKHLSEALGSSYTFVGKFKDNDPEWIETIAVYSYGNPASNFSYKIAGTPSAKVISSGVTCYLDGITDAYPNDQKLLEMKAEGYLGLPLKTSNGKTVGVLISIYDSAIPDLHYAQSIMGIFAARASAEIERLSAIQHIEHQAKVMSALYETSLAINMQTDLHSLLNEILECCIELLNAHIGGIYLLSEDKASIELVAGYNLAPYLIGIRLKLGEGLSGKIVQMGKPLMIPDYMNWEERAQVYSKEIFRRVIGVPIKAGDRTIGSINVTDSEQVGDYSENEIQILNLFADQAAIAIERARLYDELQREGLKYRNLFEHANDAIVIIDPANRQIIHANQAALDQLGYDSEQIRNLTLDQIINAQELDQTLGQLHQLELDRSLIYESAFRRKDGKLIDVEISAHIADYDKRPVVQFFSRDITERKRSEHERQKQIERISALREIDAVIASSLDLQINLGVILDQAIDHLGVDAADILLYNSRTISLETMAQKGFRGLSLPKTKVSLAKSYAGRAARKRQTIHISDLRNAPGVNTSSDFDMEGFVAYYATPLIIKGEVKGVMELFHRSPLEADPEWIDFMEILGGQAAIAIDNATLFDTLQRSNTNLTLAYDQTIEGWAESLEIQEYEAKGHSKRTADLAVRLAMELGLSPEQTADIRRGALLHDIGKLTIPESIRGKKDPLTDEEWEIVKQHPRFAFEILSKITYLKNSLSIPHYHHENWNGSGYPHGLKENDIPIAARIFSIVDVWDSLTNNQPYREAWTKTKTLEYIRNQKNIRFDPNAVDAFFKLVNATGEIKNID